MEWDIAEFDFRSASLTRLTLERGRAELQMSAAHTFGHYDWWDIIAEFPQAARVEFAARHVEMPVPIALVEIENAWNEAHPHQRILTLSGMEYTGLWLRIRFTDFEVVAEQRSETPTWRASLPPPDTRFVVEVRVTTSEEGGRHTPFFSGYRPDWWIGNSHEGSKSLYGAEVTLLDREWAFPGETVTVALRPTSPESWVHLRTGSEIEMCEGSRVCGYGTVIEVRDPS